MRYSYAPQRPGAVFPSVHDTHPCGALREAGDGMSSICVGTDSAVLFIERVSYSLESIPLEFLRIYYRGDRYVLYNELTG